MKELSVAGLCAPHLKSIILPSLLVIPRGLVVEVKYSPLYLPAPNFVQCTAKTINSILHFVSKNVPVNASCGPGGGLGGGGV